MRIWVKVISALMLIAVLLWLVMRIGGFTLSILSEFDGGSSVHDPQFAEYEEIATPPPSLTGEGEAFVEFKDNSENWDVSVYTPVDQTAEELETEARDGG